MKKQLLMGAIAIGGCGWCDSDPTTPDAARGVVTVTVLDTSGTGAVGAPVVFHGPDGELVASVSSDLAGRASAEIVPGSSVTAVRRAGDFPELFTMASIDPGDLIVLGSVNLDPSSAGSFTVSFPTLANATRYTIYGPCGRNVRVGETPSPATINLSRYCVVDTMELVITAEDASAAVIGSLSKAGIPFVDGGSTALAGPWSSPRAFTANYTNVDPIIAELRANRSVPDAYGAASLVIQTSPSATTSLSFARGVSLASTAKIDTTALTAAGSKQVLRQIIPGAGSTYGASLGGILLPWLLEPSYDSAMRKLSVPVEHTGTTEDPPDAFEATIAYDHVDVTGKLVRIVWRWVAPAPADIVFPTMPPELADIDLAPDDVVRSGTVMFDADTVDGYADFKRGMYRVRSYVILDGNARRPPATTLRNSGFEFR